MFCPCSCGGKAACSAALPLGGCHQVQVGAPWGEEPGVGKLYLKPRWHCSAHEDIFLLLFPKAVLSDAAEVCATYARVNCRALLLLNWVVAAPEGQNLPLGFLSSP